MFPRQGWSTSMFENKSTTKDREAIRVLMPAPLVATSTTWYEAPCCSGATNTPLVALQLNSSLACSCHMAY